MFRKYQGLVWLLSLPRGKYQVDSWFRWYSGTSQMRRMPLSGRSGQAWDRGDVTQTPRARQGRTSSTRR